MNIEKAKNKFDLHLLSDNGNMTRLLVIMTSTFILMSILRPQLYPTWNNISSMAYQFPEFGILSIAMAVTMIAGGIDLAIVAEANFASIVAGTILTNYLNPESTSFESATIICTAIVAAIGVGALCGLVNGFLISRIGISPILTTLGTMQVYTGLSVVITQGSAVVGFPESFASLGNGNAYGVPAPLIIFVGIAIVVSLILSRSKMGIQIFMFGSNNKASKFSGINNDKIQMIVYSLAGSLAAFAGLIIMSRTNSAKADYGQSFILQTILVSVMGGVNPRGGSGRILAVVISVITLQLISSGFNMLHLSNYLKDLVFGVLLASMLIINYYSKNRKY